MKQSFITFKLNKKLTMNIRFLETFLYIAEEGSVASAARKMHLTATAMAQRIKTLEDEIGVTLLY